jgi:hypothetical protein
MRVSIVAYCKPYYNADYILVSPPWTVADDSAAAIMNSSHHWTTLGGSERRVLVF